MRLCLKESEVKRKEVRREKREKLGEVRGFYSLGGRLTRQFLKNIGFRAKTRLTITPATITHVEAPMDFMEKDHILGSSQKYSNTICIVCCRSRRHTFDNSKYATVSQGMRDKPPIKVIS